MDIFTLHMGSVPLLISMPHDGRHVPDEIAIRLTDSARHVPDTDWHIARLYAFARALGASLLAPTHSRYVIDLNRAEDDVSLYPGQNTTGLCPIVQFDGTPIYRDGTAPDAAEARARVARYWVPYHAALRAELERIQAAHGRVLLWEGHSIKGELPFLFAGRLPDFNLGTAAGRSCTAALQSRLHAVLASQAGYDHVVNGRFQGGYITRHYGDPGNGIEAVQLEVSQRVYMDEETFAYAPAKAARAQAAIRELLMAGLQG